MNALRLAVLLCAAVVFAAFPLSLAFGQRAEVEILNERITWSATQDVECMGTIHLTTTSHWVITERIDANGGYHWTAHANLQKFTAYDDLGNEYSGSESFTESLNCGPGCEKPVEYSWVRNLRGEGHGTVPNLLIKVRYHLTVNAIGQTTVVVDWWTVECRPKD